MSFLTFGDYLDLPRSPETWIVKDIISVGGMATIYGRPKVGKSWAALGMAIAVSQGHPDWLGFPVSTHGTVAYLQIDVGGELWFSKYCQPVEGFVKNRTTLLTVDRDLAPFPFNILGSGGVWLKKTLAEINPRPVLVIIDTIRRTHVGDENDSGHVQNIMTALADAVSPSAMLIVAHARKDNPNIPESVLNDVRGSSALTGAVDTIVKLASSNPKEKGVLLFDGRTDNGVRKLRRHHSGLWFPMEETDAVVENVLTSYPTASQNSQAELVAMRLGISHRSAVRRIQEIMRKT